MPYKIYTLYYIFSQKRKTFYRTIRTTCECWITQISPGVTHDPCWSLNPCVYVNVCVHVLLQSFPFLSLKLCFFSLHPSALMGTCVVESWQGKMSSTCTQMVMDGLSACDRSALPAIYRNVNPGLCFTFLTYTLTHAANDMLPLFLPSNTGSQERIKKRSGHTKARQA